MANNISGGGFLSGLGSFTTAVTNALNLLASKILGFTSVTSVPVQKRSLILHKGYAPTLVSKRENPTSWEVKSKNGGIIKTNGTNYIVTNYSNGLTMDITEDMDTYTPVSFPLYNPYTLSSDIESPYAGTNPINVLFGIDTGVYVSTASVNGVVYYFKSKNGVENLEPLNIPTDFAFDYFNYLGTFGDTSYIYLTSAGTNATKVYKTSKIEANGLINGQYSQVIYTEITSLSLLTNTGSYIRPSYDAKIQYVNGVYALAMTSNKIMTSSDGINFTEVSTNVGQNLSLTSHNNTFIYISNSEISPTSSFIFYTTPDFVSTNTKMIIAPENYPGNVYGMNVKFASSATVNNKLYVPISGSTYFLVSEDAETWSLEDAGVNIEYDMNLLAGTVTVNLSLAGGSSYYTTMIESKAPGYILLSERYSFYLNSLSENLNTPRVFTVFNPDSIVDINDTYITQGLIDLSADSGGGMLFSKNGKDWEQGSTGITYRGLQRFNNLVIGYSRNAIGYSLDGINWSSIDVAPSTSFITDLNVIGNKIYASVFRNLPSDGGVHSAYSSSNGTSWLRLDTPNTFDTNQNDYYFRIIGSASNISSSSLIALVNDYDDRDYAFLSTNSGFTWNRITLPFSGRLYFAGNKFFLTNNSITKLSSNLSSWEDTNLTDFQEIEYISTNNTYGTTNSNSPTQTSYLKISTDGGYSWTESTHLGLFKLNKVINNKFFLTRYNTVGYSSDGNEITLFNVSPGSSNFFASIYGPLSTLVETQISIGNQGSGTAEVLTPVILYKTAPFGQGTPENPESAFISKITLKNLSAYPVSVDIARFGLYFGGTTMNSDTVQVNDQIIQPNQTFTYEPSDANGILYGDMSFVVLPSSVDAIEAKIYSAY